MRGAIIAVLLIGGWMGWVVRTARIQQEAVAAIREAGGQVMYDWEWKDGYPIPNGGPWAPKWLTGRFGTDYFGSVVYVGFDVFGTYMANLNGNGRFDAAALPSYKLRFDAALLRLGDFRRLEELDLSTSQITDSGLTHLTGLTSLRTLNLRGTQVTDAGVERLQRVLPHVRILRQDLEIDSEMPEQSWWSGFQ
jgi:hypothetical protein